VNPVAEARRDGPLNQRIRADIEARILSGAWPPGHRIPFEHELMAEYGCARMTVSKVLASLVEAGLIERRRRAGSFVRRPSAQSAVLEIPDIKAEVAGRGEAYGLELRSSAIRKANKEDRALLDAPAGASVLALACRHLADGVPHAYEERRIALDVVPEAAAADFSVDPPGTWLLNHIPWSEAEHFIGAAAADERIGALLDIPAGAPCLVLDRRTWRGPDVLTAVRVWYPAARQRLTARFTPAGK
jgi:GntR family histidine utilization transcriptional repressor